jgi:hypothetical protein
MAKISKLLTPKEIPTDISRDFPGRFHAEASELRGLVSEIEHILRVGSGQQKNINFWVRLENGTLYKTNDLEIVLRDENENSRLSRTRITLLVIIADLVGEKDVILKRIVVQFSRARVDNPRFYSWEHIQDETFNLNFHGINFRVRDKNRKSAMDIIEKLESKVKRFRDWYSIIPGNYEVFRKLLIQGLLFIIYGLVCFLPALILEHFRLPLPINLSGLVHDLLAAGSLALIAFGLFFILSILLFIISTLFLPTTYFEIGDEIKEYKKSLRTKIIAFIGIIIIGILTSILSDVIINLFKASSKGAGG